MFNIDRALGDNRRIKAITGLSASEFNKLRKNFKMKRGSGMKQELNLGIENEKPLAVGE
nr:hypothetical protein GZ11A10_9 [uncultured archaeon GZfos11A10]